MAKATDPPDWFEISDRDYLDPHFKGKKLKLLADQQVPAPVIAELRAANIAVDPFPSSGKRASDTTVLLQAECEQRVLLTLDADFWDDHKHPLHSLRTGIIYV